MSCADETAREPHLGLRRLGAVVGATSMLIAACTSSPRADASAADCFDTAEITGLVEAWEDIDHDRGQGTDMARLAARLRAAGEIASEFALATAADPVAAAHFEDAADAYLKASLEAISDNEGRRLGRTMGEAVGGISLGIEALNYSPIPFC